MKITFYDSDEEMWADLDRAMKAADERVNPTQASIKPGQYFINFAHGPELPIFGEILPSDDQIYQEPHMKYYRLTKAYSIGCPYGEIGDIHISQVSAIIDKELFDFYEQNGWLKPQD